MDAIGWERGRERGGRAHAGQCARVEGHDERRGVSNLAMRLIEWRSAEQDDQRNNVRQRKRAAASTPAETCARGGHAPYDAVRALPHGVHNSVVGVHIKRCAEDHVRLYLSRLAVHR